MEEEAGSGWLEVRRCVASTVSSLDHMQMSILGFGAMEGYLGKGGATGLDRLQSLKSVRLSCVILGFRSSQTPALLPTCPCPAGPLPDTDPELLDWIEACMQTSTASPGRQLINFNYASEYHQVSLLCYSAWPLDD